MISFHKKVSRLSKIKMHKFERQQDLSMALNVMASTYEINLNSYRDATKLILTRVNHIKLKLKVKNLVFFTVTTKSFLFSFNFPDIRIRNFDFRCWF